MPVDYRVKQGDCISSIAFDRGFFWETLWNHPDNAQLRRKREDPNVLLTGDVVHLPDLTLKEETCATQQRHRFRRLGVPEKLRMVLLEANNTPKEGWEYRVVIDGRKISEGVLPSSGELTCSITPNAQAGKVYLSKGTAHEEIELALGTIDPIDTVSGIQARLVNLGLLSGAITGELDSRTAGAVAAFQDSNGLLVTGEPDDVTRARLRKVHGF